MFTRMNRDVLIRLHSRFIFKSSSQLHGAHAQVEFGEQNQKENEIISRQCKLVGWSTIARRL
jgi:hypothetical protein